MTLEQAIEHAEEVASDQECLMSRYDAASGYARSGNEAIRTESAKECEKCADEHRQLAEWLRELKERRKAPEIVRCGECKYLRRWISTNHQFCDITACKVSEDEFCNRAERRTE